MTTCACGLPYRDHDPITGGAFYGACPEFTKAGTVPEIDAIHARQGDGLSAFEAMVEATERKIPSAEQLSAWAGDDQ